MLTKQHLKNALLDGEFILPFHWTFYSGITKDFDCCVGESKEMGSDLICQPVRLSDNKKALLVSLTDTKNQTWYSWIHAD